MSRKKKESGFFKGQIEPKNQIKANATVGPYWEAPPTPFTRWPWSTSCSRFTSWPCCAQTKGVNSTLVLEVKQRRRKEGQFSTA